MGLKRENKMLYCKKCGMYKAFYKEEEKWLCIKCGKEVKNGEVK